MEKPRPAPGPPAGSGCGNGASCPRRDRGPRGRCRAAPGTSRSGAPPRPRLRIRPSLPWPNRDLDDPDVGRLGSLGGLAKLVFDLRALGEGTEAVTRDTGEVHESILAPVIRGDESEALLVAEPLHDTGSHPNTSSQ